MTVLLALLIMACSTSSTETDTTTPDAVPASQDTGDIAAPDFQLTTFSNAEHRAGETVTLSQFTGQPVVLNFWFPSCPPCVAEMPHFENVYQKLKPQGVNFIGVQLLGLDSAEDGQKFVERLGVNYILGPDQADESVGDIVRSYEVSGFPTTVFIDRNHNIRRTWSGPLSEEKLEELIREIL